MATTQELFDRIIDHFVKQGHRAINSADDCMYRAPNGDMCAIGCLISDEAYTPDLEQKPTSAESVQAALKASGVDAAHRTRFFDHMQFAHDNSDHAMELRDRLRQAADEYDLNDAKVSNITNWE